MYACEYEDGTYWEQTERCPPDYQGFGLVSEEFLYSDTQYTLPVEVFERQGPPGPAGPAGEVPWFAIAAVAGLGFLLLGRKGR